MTVIKSGLISYAQMVCLPPIPHLPSHTQKGDPNGSIPTIEPIISRPMFAPLVPSTSILFVSQASITSGAIASYGLKKRVEAVRNCRKIGKRDMKFNDAMPKMNVDPENYRVEADGVHATCEPATVLPLAQAAFVY
jgi:urease